MATSEVNWGNWEILLVLPLVVRNDWSALTETIRGRRRRRRGVREVFMLLLSQARWNLLEPRVI